MLNKRKEMDKEMVFELRLLEGVVDDASPGRQGSESCALCVDLVPVKLTEAGVDVNVLGSQERLALPEPANDPETEDDGSSQVLLEEVLCGTHARCSGRGSNSGIELKAERLVKCLILVSDFGKVYSYLGHQDNDANEKAEI